MENHVEPFLREPIMSGSRSNGHLCFYHSHQSLQVQNSFPTGLLGSAAWCTKRGLIGQLLAARLHGTASVDGDGAAQRCIFPETTNETISIFSLDSLLQQVLLHGRLEHGHVELALRPPVATVTPEGGGDADEGEDRHVHGSFRSTGDEEVAQADCHAAAYARQQGRAQAGHL